jgi:hypothetical protein
MTCITPNFKLFCLQSRSLLISYIKDFIKTNLVSHKTLPQIILVSIMMVAFMILAFVEVSFGDNS